MIAPSATSIRLFLADGTPDGLWVVEKSNWTGLALMAPRSQYATLRARPEMSSPGVYVLVGPAEGQVKSTRIYVGETDVLRDRLDNHQKRKDFWTRAIVFTAKDANLNKAHVRYLESRLLGLAALAKRVELDNGPTTSLPALSEADQADMEAFLADMLVIYPVLGLNAFEAPDETTSPAERPRLYLNAKGTVAEGRETADGFIVYAGSLARPDEVPSIHAYITEQRGGLQREGVLVNEGDHLKLTEDHVFSSPSNAAMVLLGRTANGRIGWKTAEGTTRKALQERAASDDS